MKKQKFVDPNYTRTIIITVLVLIALVSIITLIAQSQSQSKAQALLPYVEFSQCLADNGMVIYGSQFCPYCNELAQLMGGYEAVQSVYVECTVEQARCAQETLTDYVPEVQLNGEVFEGERTLSSFAQATGCTVPLS